MEVNDFKAIRISLASPEQIKSWSHGEVTKPETINYRTLRPERDGLFCERIFGPTKDWECYCGKYKRLRYKGITCEKCGVDVVPSRVRRERMGHIELASPVSHIWYVKGVPSRLGLLLNISPRNLERVLYFAQYIITRVDEEQRNRILSRQEGELTRRTGRLEGEYQEKIGKLEVVREEALSGLDQKAEAAVKEMEDRRDTRADEITIAAQRIQSLLEANMGKVTQQAILLPWREEPLAEAGETIKREHLDELKDSTGTRLSEIEATTRDEQSELRMQYGIQREHARLAPEDQIEQLRAELERQKNQMREEHEKAMAELRLLESKQLLTESRYRELSDRWGNVFSAGMGAEAIRAIVEDIDLQKKSKELRMEIRTSRSKQRRKKAAKQLRVVEAFRKSGNRPEWMILTVLPVIPPDLRPMVQLDGGRFATSDLNDLYRRVINRNNRLRRLLELGAPDVIVRNEKRMLQEAVDSLIDNGRRGRAVSRSGKRKLKSLSDMLKGKQGRFRRNLLGKRVDYSGRSVIVIGPDLKLNQCGLPKRMALELFRPFVMRRLVEYNYAHNIKSAKRLVDRLSPEVWDVLEEITKERLVLLNRAPTLHRLGIQAFEVVLIEGNAIQIHPLVCSAFNADFDGDQMAVHVPLSDSAVHEARRFMLSTINLLKPASGEPIVGPSKDMVLGCYYLTVEKPGAKGEGKIFADFDEVKLAYDLGVVDLQARIQVRWTPWYEKRALADIGLSERVRGTLAEAGLATAGAVLHRMARDGGELTGIKGFGKKAAEELRERFAAQSIPLDRVARSPLLATTVGRVLFNMILPEELQFVKGVTDVLMDKGAVNKVVAECYSRLGQERTADLVDKIKEIGFTYATRSGMTIAVSDINVPEAKKRILDEATQQVEKVEQQYRRGLITEQEKSDQVVQLWNRAKEEITQEVKKLLSDIEGIGAMAKSGATKGGINPISQLAGMRGLMADPSGRIIDLPVRSNFREGLTALEYFLSTHGARKGLADTALRTADAGYLTRRLVDVAQDVIISEEDCGSPSGVWIESRPPGELGETFAERIVGRLVSAPVAHPETGEILVERDQLLDEATIAMLERAGVQRVFVRSPLTCTTRFGLCIKCYGRDLARGGFVRVGEAVGIIAAQSIGEPGTQLTLRTFHTGGVAGTEDITQGLPRVEELFEAREPKGKAVISEIDGEVDIYWEGETRKIKVSDARVVAKGYPLEEGWTPTLASEDRVQEDTVIATGPNGEETVAGMDGKVFYEEEADGRLAAFIRREDRTEWEQEIPASARLRVIKGDRVRAGDQLTEGPKDPKEVLRIQGRDALQQYILEEIQKVYRSQGVNIHDKHIELVVRQMVRKVRVLRTGDSDFLPGELADRFVFDEVNRRLVEQGKTPARGETILLGVTKASLNTESFLAAASFQETTRVLTEAAVRGSRDDLRGLKENVIIGKLIPVGTGFEERQRRLAAGEVTAAPMGLQSLLSLGGDGSGDEIEAEAT